MHRFFIQIILTLICIDSFSAHIVGGEMYYECIQGNKYMITMKIYRDCNSDGADFDAPARFSIFDESNTLAMQTSAFIHSVSYIDPNTDSPCISYPPDICIQEGIYKFQIELPSNTQSYKIVYQRCCRNATIQNLINPAAQGLTIEVEVPASAHIACNSMPSFNNFPPPVLCAQEPLYFDHSATDLDGDSLVYFLCSPYLGGTSDIPAPNPTSNPPFNPVVWGPNYNETNPIDASPGLSIDPHTGILTGKPTQLGQYVVGVCVEEWRDGQLLSRNTRDFQFNLALCEQTYTAVIGDPDPADLCGNLNIQFVNLSDPTNEFIWNFGDPENPLAESTAYNPSYTYPDTGTYQVMLISNPGFFCSDTAYLTLPLYNELQINAGINGFQCVEGEQVFSFSANGAFDESAIITWNFGENASPQSATGTEVEGVVFSETGLQSIAVEVTENVCDAQDQINVNIPPPPQVAINQQENFCMGLTHQFSHQSQNASLFHWTFKKNNTIVGESNQANPNFTFPEPGIYEVSLSANNPDNCPVVSTAIFDIQPLLAPDIEPHDIYCLNGNAVSFKPIGSFSDQAVFNWEFQSATPPTSNEKEPTNIKYDASGNHAVKLTVSENGCARTAQSEVIIHQNPIADFDVGKIYGCAPLSVSFLNRSATQSSSVAYTYDFGDGNTSTSGTTSHTYTAPGVYGVSLFLQNLNGCIDSDEIYKEAIIEVAPSPKAGFVLSPDVVSVIDPIINILDDSRGGTSCRYYFDNKEFDECSFEHTLQIIEAQSVIQIVENEYGCSDKAEKEFFVSDHLIYIPNSFTPDGDGLNDFFFPVATGAANINMTIYNRWGEVVYQNKTDTKGWNGQSKDRNYFSEPGVYNYIIVLTDNLGWNFEYKGSVRLIR